MRSSVERHFSKAAEAYQRDAGLQREIARLLCDLIRVRPAHIFEIGCGTGFLTTQLIEVFPGAAISAIDISQKMIELAAPSLPPDRVELLIGDFLTSDLPPCSYDLVASSSSLQWIRPLDTALERSAKLLRPGGLLACSLFSAGTLGDLHDIRRQVAPQKSFAIRLPDRSEIEQALRSACFEEYAIEEREFTVQYENVLEFFSGIRRLGFTAVTETGYQPLCRGEIAKLREAYAARCGSNARFVASFVVAKLAMIPRA